MLNPELWINGATVMTVGMGTVFSFLVVLIFAILISTKVVEFVNKICPVEVPQAKTSKSAKTDDAEIALAVAIAKAQG